jgi:flavin-binding protein dodecin
MVYKLINLVGTSKDSFAEAAKSAVIEAAKTVRNIRRAEVIRFDMKMEDDKVALYRAEVGVWFEIER